MEIKDNIIDKNKYEYYMSNIGWLGYEKVVDKLKGKVLECEYRTIDDCAVNFVSDLLNCDWGRSIVYDYSKYALDFIKSSYLSNYFKDSIRELFGESITKELDDILNSDKDISQMDEKEIKIIYDSIVEFYNTNEEYSKSNISSYILTYLYKLDGVGVSSFIKNNIDSEKIARHILLTSGLNDRASFYSGRGVMHCDLNSNNLVAIFFKLLRLDESYAIDFIEMVCDIKTLGATEFIESFINFGDNKFNYKKENIVDSNISLDGVYGKARFAVALETMFSSLNRRDDNYEISESSSMKVAFLNKIKKALKQIEVSQIDKMYEVIREQEFIYDNREDYWDWNYRRYR